MGDEAFDEQLLVEKLSKLNSSQQSIESLSRWCISHRKRAKQIVETWDKLFKSAQREQRVSFLYLANDILQNSRRKGSEFVNEFWKVLPAALKRVYENGDESGKKVAARLVDIWEERKVFGSRGQNLKDVISGKNPPQPVSNGKSLNPIRVVKRDAQSLRLKLAVGAMPEKILTAFQLVHDENVNEEAALDKCKDAISCVGEIEKDIENMSSQGSLHDPEFVDKIQEQESVLQECLTQLENAEALKLALVSQLKEALQEQESSLAILRDELLVARGRIEQAANTRQRLTSPVVPAAPVANNNAMSEISRVVEASMSSGQLIPTSLPPPPPMTVFAASKNNEEENKRAAAAAVAAKLAASTSSAQMLSSVLSSLVAEEAASFGSALKSAGFSSSVPFSPPGKRPKLDKPMHFADAHTSEGGNSGYLNSTQQPLTSGTLAPSGGMQPMSQSQTPFAPPPPPPMAPVPPTSSSANHIVQSAAAMMGVLPYGYGNNNLPPPLPSHIAMGLARPPPLPLQQPQAQQPQHSQQSPQQQPANGGYFGPPGFGFYSQGHQPSTPPVPRQ